MAKSDRKTSKIVSPVYDWPRFLKLKEQEENDGQQEGNKEIGEEDIVTTGDNINNQESNGSSSSLSNAIASSVDTQASYYSKLFGTVLNCFFVYSAKVFFVFFFLKFS